MSNEPMLELYIFETTQLLEQLENCIISTEKTKSLNQDSINEIFRIMHTIKGSSAMMLFDHIANLTHTVEDLFYYLRENNPKNLNYSVLSDLILEVIDFTKVELIKITAGDRPDGNPESIIQNLKNYLLEINEHVDISEQIIDTKHYYITQDKNPRRASNHFKATIYFEDGCQMENIHAYTVVHNLTDIAEEISHIPEDIIEDQSISVIRQNGFKLFFGTNKSYEEIQQFLMNTLFLKDLELESLNQDEFLAIKEIEVPKLEGLIEDKEIQLPNAQQTIISVSVAKLDKLMDLVGEMVIAEAMVTQNPDLRGLDLENFYKAARQLNKITSELQDMVMSIRMVPLSTTFHKMHRIVRDMNKKLNKDVELILIGEETEVDKNIIEHISDPLMHLIRNAIDHGIETIEERQIVGKSETGTIILEAKNSGSDVIVTLKDDGIGLNKDKILKRAKENDLLKKPESELTEREIFNLIFLPGFSTKDSVTEFSGRGVGMDVVTQNLQSVGGSVLIDSVEGKGTTVTLRIPLTLAIIDGMNLRVGRARYTIPTMAIKESFRPKESDIIQDPDGNELIMVRGQCYPIIRLHEIYKVDTLITNFTEGIFIMIEDEDGSRCIFADELLGQQQVVVKALPQYFQTIKKVKGFGGCTLLGDGSISLILNLSTLIKG